MGHWVGPPFALLEAPVLLALLGQETPCTVAALGCGHQEAPAGGRRDGKVLVLGAFPKWGRDRLAAPVPSPRSSASAASELVPLLNCPRCPLFPAASLTSHPFAKPPCPHSGLCTPTLGSDSPRPQWSGALAPASTPESPPATQDSRFGWRSPPLASFRPPARARSQVGKPLGLFPGPPSLLCDN